MNKWRKWRKEGFEDGRRCPECGGQVRTIHGFDQTPNFDVGGIEWCRSCKTILSVEFDEKTLGRALTTTHPKETKGAPL